MKQHITIEQLSELDDKAKEKLYKWSLGKGYIKAINFHQELLSIGQMVEFIKEHGKVKENWIDGSWENIIGNNSYAGYNKGELTFAIGWEKDLCNELWEAVKYILKEKK